MLIQIDSHTKHWIKGSVLELLKRRQRWQWWKLWLSISFAEAAEKNVYIIIEVRMNNSTEKNVYNHQSLRKRDMASATLFFSTSSSSSETICLTLSTASSSSSTLMRRLLMGRFCFFWFVCRGANVDSSGMLSKH